MKRSLILFILLAIVCATGRSSATPKQPTELRDQIRLVLGNLQRSMWDADEDPSEQAARLDLAADAMAAATKDEFEAAALLTIGGVETNFAGYVAAGCKYPEGIPKGASTCDNGTSRSYWQMKITACRTGWALERGSTQALFAFAKCARARFLGSLKRCDGRHPGGRLAGAFAGYRSVDCEWEGRPYDGARARAAALQVRLSQLYQARQPREETSLALLPWVPPPWVASHAYALLGSPLVP